MPEIGTSGSTAVIDENLASHDPPEARAYDDTHFNAG
jgi:hypothetical protein